MPFQSEKQRRFLHANHPEIAKRWEKEYAHGGILDINESEEIISDDGNDIELTAYNAAFDDPNDLSTGVRTLFMKKGGQAIGGGSIQGEPREDRTGFRNPHQDSYSSGQSYSGSTSSGGHPHGGVASQYSAPSTSTSTRSKSISEEKQEEFQKQQIKDVTKGTLSDPQEKYDSWEQEFQDVPGTLEGPQTSIYKNKVNVAHTKDVYEKALANQKSKLKSMGLSKLMPLFLMIAFGVPPMDALKAFPKTISVSAEDMRSLITHGLPVMKAKKAHITALGLQKTALLGQVDILNPNEMKSEIGTQISDITKEIKDLTKTRDEDDTGGDGSGPTLPPQLGGPSTEEMATEYDFMGWMRANQARKKAYDEKIEREKLAREDNPIVGTTETDIIALRNSGGLANLFRVKNQ
jgi:hypothetical protein